MRIMAGWNVPSGDISDSVVFEDEIWTAFNYFSQIAVVKYDV